jgi:hypothetical protein
VAPAAPLGIEVGDGKEGGRGGRGWERIVDEIEEVD